MGVTAPASAAPEVARLAEDQKNPDGLSKTASAYRKAAPIFDAVWQMIGSVLLATLAGWWLDKKLGTQPWLLVAGSVLGVAAGMYAFLRAALAGSKRPPRGPGDGGGQQR